MTTYAVTPCDASSLNAVLEFAARALDSRRERQAATGFRASGLSGCLRQRGYEVLGIEETDVRFNANYYLAAEQGRTIHERIQEWLVESGMVYDFPGFGPAVELPLSVCCPEDARGMLETLPFSGHIDAVLDYKSSLAILDIKTVASKYLAPGGFLGDYPWLAGKLQSYAVQLHAYMRFCAAPDGRRPERGFVLMVSRDDTSIRRLYEVPWQPDVFFEDMDRLQNAAADVRNGKLPDADPTRGPCVFCRYRTRCAEEGGDPK